MVSFYLFNYFMFLLQRENVTEFTIFINESQHTVLHIFYYNYNFLNYFLKRFTAIVYGFIMFIYCFIITFPIYYFIVLCASLPTAGVVITLPNGFTFLDLHRECCKQGCTAPFYLPGCIYAGRVLLLYITFNCEPCVVL